MKLELKNVLINNEFSEETLMFKADVYVNGKKCAYASNDGRGGCTFYNAYSHELRSLLKEAEDFMSKKPSRFVNYSGRTIEIKSSIENWIDDVVTNIHNNKERAKLKRKMDKDMINNLVYTKDIDTGYKMIGWKNLTIEQMLNRVDGRLTIRKKVEELVNEGYTIMNTNLPKDNFGNYLF